MPRTVIFTGPSLAPVEAARMIDATILPPIKRGDLDDALRFDPEVIGIIDGEFYQSLAVSPKEILPLLERGLRVYGAASMGALRAVELERCGMIGVGSVFRLFRRGVLERDDEVALTYCPWTWEAVSEPLVNTRYALRSAVRTGIVTRAEARQILSSLQSAWFPERTRALMLGIARDIAGPATAASLATFLTAHPVNQKNTDAVALVRKLSLL